MWTPISTAASRARLCCCIDCETISRSHSSEPPPSEEPEASLYWDIVIGLRNRAVIADIPAEEEGPIGILYGADHLADLESRLERRGWETQDEAWLPAIAVRHDDLGLGPVQVRQLMEGARSGSLR